MTPTTNSIKQRYSCRNFSSKKISRKIITNLLDLANYAPSASNKQNRHFVVVTKSEDRNFLAKMNKQKHFAQAPVSIIVASAKEQFPHGAKQYLKVMEKFSMTSWGATSTEFNNKPKFLKLYKKMSQQLFPISDAAAAITTLLLAACDKGISSCWIGVYDEEAIKTRFNIPDDYLIAGCVILGYQKEKPNWRAPRKEIKKLISWDKWGNSDL